MLYLQQSRLNLLQLRSNLEKLAIRLQRFAILLFNYKHLEACTANIFIFFTYELIKF